MADKNLIFRTNMPLMAMRGVVVFPYMVTHFDVGREKSLKALEAAMAKEQLVVLAAQKEAECENPEENDIYSYGTLVKIKQLVRLPQDSVKILVEGIGRVKICEFVSEFPYFSCDVEQICDDEDDISPELNDALVRNLKKSFEVYFSYETKVSADIMAQVSKIDNASKLCDTICANIYFEFEDKQSLLQTIDVESRVQMLLALLKKEIEIIRLEQKISENVKKRIDENQREYYLREQLKVISDELGDKDGIGAEIAEYKKKFKEFKFDKDTEDKLLKELDRLSKTPSGSPEAAVIRTYLDNICDLPWVYKTRQRIDINKAQQILDEDHYGLKKVKERVLEYLAVRKLSKNTAGFVLCLAGPPGVGKTSVAKSIARAINRKYVRVSLGGVKDEAEIRGHRKTYIGSMPGRIINALKSAKSKNPLILLDEIDKMSNDYKGDPASAMLEVLDGEQNFSFRDHYIEIPFDLSDVFFITTANTLETIAPPLLDRMEIINIEGYTDEEKTAIAIKYLIPKQLAKNGINKEKLDIDESAVIDIIKYYTRESGVRNLEREITSVMRKAAKKIAQNNNEKIIVNQSNLEEYLGKKKYKIDLANEKDEVGIVRGLAWTSVGGETLSVEVNVMSGSGKLELTGNLGDVMKESAKTALSYIRSCADKLSIERDFYKKLDIHIHIPEGAVPKDGPSAGITMTTALVSALTGYAVKCDTAMTGEVTLRGNVLPIGGLKEKTLAAYRAGIKTVIIPKENERDLEDIDVIVRKNIKFITASTMDDVLKHALTAKKEKHFNLPLEVKEEFVCPIANDFKTSEGLRAQNKQ